MSPAQLSLGGGVLLVSVGEGSRRCLCGHVRDVHADDPEIPFPCAGDDDNECGCELFEAAPLSPRALSMLSALRGDAPHPAPCEHVDGRACTCPAKGGA